MDKTMPVINATPTRNRLTLALFSILLLVLSLIVPLAVKGMNFPGRDSIGLVIYLGSLICALASWRHLLGKVVTLLVIFEFLVLAFGRMPG
ncbi:MAG: hypothetical protein AB7F75_10840 [Planctomycetota bacterium]